MPDCQFCAEMPAVVNQRWCEPCWAEICEAGKRVEELRAFYMRVDRLDAKYSAGNPKTRENCRFARLVGTLARLTTRKITTVKLWRGKK